MRFLVFAAMFLTFGVIHGASAATAGTSISKSELSKALKFYRDIQDLTVDFKMSKRMKDIPTVLQSEGQLRIARPNILVWKITKPAPLTVDIGKDEVKITSGLGSDLTTQSFRLEQIANNPDAGKFQSMKAWLSMDAETLSQDYEIEKSADGAFIFRPKRPGEVPFSKLTMRLNPRGDLRKLQMEEKTGDSTEFEFDRPRIKSQAGKK